MKIISARELAKTFGRTRAVDGVSFEVGEGEIFGFLGPNGAGKTTTIKMLATLLSPTSGTATVGGHDVTREPAAVRASIGLVFQDPSLDDDLTAQENLFFHSLIYRMPRHEFMERADGLLKMVGLDSRRNDQVKTYSGGMKRRLELIRGLLHRPHVIFLDEPTLGLDPQTRAAIWEHVRALRTRDGTTVFMTTHYMEEAEYCDRIAIIDYGKIIALDTPAALKAALRGDVVTIRTADNEAAARDIEARYGIAVKAIEDGKLRFEMAAGESFVPKFIAASPQTVLEISVHRPSLEDVFLDLTGHRIREEQGTPLDQMRVWMRGRRG